MCVRGFQSCSNTRALGLVEHPDAVLNTRGVRSAEVPSGAGPQAPNDSVHPQGVNRDAQIG